MHAQAGHATASQFYTIVSPTGIEHEPPPGRAWTYTRPRFEELVTEGRVYWPSGGDGKPRLKRFEHEAQGLVPSTWWSAEEVGENSTAKRELKRLFPGTETFATPKPEQLLERIIHIGSQPGEIVLDCFAGSGVTPAVAHKMGRRWLAVELNDETVSTFITPRLDRVAQGGDPWGVTAKVDWIGGGGFRTISVLPPLYGVGPAGAAYLTADPDDPRVAIAVAGQLGFKQAIDPPFIGRRGRMRLAYVPGAVGPEDVVALAGALGGDERLTVVAMAVLPGAEAALAEASPGSRVLKLPRDVLAAKRRRGAFR